MNSGLLMIINENWIFFFKKMTINKLVFVECIQITKNEHSDERINVVIVDDDDDNDVDVIYSAASFFFCFTISLYVYKCMLWL